MKILIVTIVAALGICAHARLPVKKMKVHSELRAELNSVLREAVALQEAAFSGNTNKTNKCLMTLVKAIDRAESKGHLAKGQKVHLLKLLEATKGHLARGVRTDGMDRHSYMQLAFKQVVTLAQTYELDRYKIFFCHKDRSVWLQKSGNAQNPVNPETYGNCGKQVL